MPSKSEKLTFKAAGGHELSARLDKPLGEIRAYAIFAHCFTCSKDVFAASRVSTGLADRGIAVLRFDFTGLGASEGDFAETNFSSDVDDLIAAAKFLEETAEAPKLLVGHSFGGAAVLAAAPQLDSVKAVATIGAPSGPDHVKHVFEGSMDHIMETGEANVDIAGRCMVISKEFVEDIGAYNLLEKVAGMKKALMVFHAPKDQTVGVENAAEIFGAAMHPKSFVSLDNADHLLTRKSDAIYVADMISAWAARFIEDGKRKDNLSIDSAEPGVVLVSETGEGKFANRVVTGEHVLRADEPLSVPGGRETGPSPYDYVLAGLGACTSMTLRMYADHKGFPLDKVSVRLKHEKIHAEDCADCESKEGRVDSMEREVELTGDLTEDQRARLLEIANKCPVHKTLEGDIKVTTRLKG